MRASAVVLASLLPLTPACAIYTTSVVSERVVDTERVTAEGISEAGRAPSDGLTVRQRSGVAVAFPAGATVTHVRGGIVVDAGPGKGVEAFASDEVAAVELREGRFHDVKHRKVDHTATAVVGTLAVVGVTALIIGGALAVQGAFQNDGFGAGLGAGFGLGLL